MTFAGAGPNGELRYPSTPADRWSFPGIGAFQCYDEYMVASLRTASIMADHPEW